MEKQITFINWKINKRLLSHIEWIYMDRPDEIPDEMRKTDFTDAKEVAKQIREHLKESGYIMRVQLIRYKIGADFISVGPKHDCYDYRERCEIAEKLKYLQRQFSNPAVMVLVTH